MIHLLWNRGVRKRARVLDPAPLANPFIAYHAPLAWVYLIQEFGTEVDYWPQGNDLASVIVKLIWVEGVEDEQSSPGRYSHVRIKNADLPEDPRRGDAIDKNGVIYDVVRVNAYAYGFGTLVVQERS